MSMYRFTGKELDPETGLYYYGARYYDPVLSNWISADPILMKYLPTGNKDQDEKLAGFGGVYNPANLGLYGYAHLNPLIYRDPNGAEPNNAIFDVTLTYGLQFKASLTLSAVKVNIDVNFGRDEVSLNNQPMVTQSYGATIEVNKVGGIGFMWERNALGQTELPQQNFYTGKQIPGTGCGYGCMLGGKPFKFKGPYWGKDEVSVEGGFGNDLTLSAELPNRQIANSSAKECSHARLATIFITNEAYLLGECNEEDICRLWTDSRNAGAYDCFSSNGV